MARLWRGFLLFFSRWWQLEALYRSNMKYQPDWIPRYACYEDARMFPRVGVASGIAEGYLVLPFTRRDEQHTGHHSSVPPTLLATGLLHDDGSAPDVLALQEADFGDGDAHSRRLPEQMRVRLSKLKALQDSRVLGQPTTLMTEKEIVCQNCGALQPRWVGQCPDCAAWNTLVETVVSAPAARARSAAGDPPIARLESISAESVARLPSSRLSLRISSSRCLRCTTST